MFNTLFKFVDEVVLKPYLDSKNINHAELTRRAEAAHRVHAKAKWDYLMQNIDLTDVRHASRRWIVVRDGEFRIDNEETADRKILPYDSFALGFVDYMEAVRLVVESLPKSISIQVKHDVTHEGHAKLIMVAAHPSANLSDLTERALNQVASEHSLRTEFYLDPLGLDPYSGQFQGKVTDDLAFWMGDVVDLLAAAEALNREFRGALLQQMRSRRGVSGGFAVEVPTHDTSAQFSNFLERTQAAWSGLDLSQQVIKQMPIAPHGTFASRTWGIEVETGGARGVDTPKEWGRKYDGSLCSAYEESSSYIDPTDCDASDHREYIYKTLEAGESFVLNGESNIATSGGTFAVDNPDYTDPDWCDYCGYRDEEPDDDEDCAEFVSPILRSFHSRGLESLIGQLQGNPQNDSAGIHVHVGASDLTPKQVGALVIAYQMIEPLITSSYNRTARSYCKPREAWEVIQVVQGAKRAKSLPLRGNSDREFRTGDRYHSVNLCALSAHGTIEFRSMGPVTERDDLTDATGVDYEHLIQWALFCREMVNVAKANAPVKAFASAGSMGDVIAIFAKYGKEVPAILSAELDEQLDAAAELEAALVEI